MNIFWFLGMQSEFFKRSLDSSRSEQFLLPIVIEIHIRHIAICLMNQDSTILKIIENLENFSKNKINYLFFCITGNANVFNGSFTAWK